MLACKEDWIACETRLHSYSQSFIVGSRSDAIVVLGVLPNEMAGTLNSLYSILFSAFDLP